MSSKFEVAVIALSDKTLDAYSADRYGSSWSVCCRVLLRRGYSEQEAEAILRSKWMRWAGDSAKNPDRPTSKDLERYLDDPRNLFTKEEVAKLVEETFGH